MSQNNKKVLVVAYFFPPMGGGGVQRTVKFVKYLRDFGYEPVVLTVKSGQHTVFDASLSRDIPKGVRIIRTNYFGLFFGGSEAKSKERLSSLTKKSDEVAQKTFSWKSLLRAPYHFVERMFLVPDIQTFWRGSAYRKAIKVLRKEHFDLIYSTSSPYTSHLIARDLHRETKIPWVADFRDHWTLGPMYQPASFVHQWIDRSYERSILREASGVVFNTERNQKDIDQFFPEIYRKACAIHNGFDSEDIHETAYYHEDEIKCFFPASFYGKVNSPEKFLKALEIVSKKVPNISLSIAGDIDATNRHMIESSPLYGKNIFLQGWIAHSEVTKFTTAATFLLLFVPPLTRAASWVPQKLYEYLASGRPIFALAPKNGEATEIIEKTQTGYTVSSDLSVEDTAKELLKFLEGLKAKNWQQRANKDEVGKFTRKNLTKKLAEFFDEVVDEA